MKKHFSIIGLTLFLVAISTACYFPKFVSSEDLIATEVDIAFNEIMKQTEEAKAAATYTPYPTYTPAPTYTAQSVYVPYREPYYPSDSASRFSSYCLDPDFISETIPDNTVFNNGESFTKTWTILNDGRCTWTTDYDLVFVSGNSLSGDTVSALPHDVAPDEIVVLSVDLTAPSSDGTYRGNWAIRSDNGNKFATFWVQIRVD